MEFPGDTKTPPTSTTQSQPPSTVHGAALIHDPVYNKGLSFPIQERVRLNLHGLLPPAVAPVEVTQQRPNDYSSLKARFARVAPRETGGRDTQGQEL